MHIMKTGGTSFHLHSQESLDPATIYPGRGFCSSPADLREAKMSSDRLLGAAAPPHDRVRLYTVHLPLWAYDALGQDLVTIAVLRDPVERTISHLRHIAREEMVGCSLEEVYEFHGAAMLRNYRIGHFSATSEEWEETSERRRLWYTRRSVGTADLPADGGELPMDDVRFERAVNRLKDLDLAATLDMFDHRTAQMIDRFGGGGANFGRREPSRAIPHH